MTGPYVAQIFLNKAYVDVGDSPSETADLTLKWGGYLPGNEQVEPENVDLLKEGERISYRYYRSGQGATLIGTLRAAVFAAASLLEPGEQAIVALYGRNVEFRGQAMVRADGAHVRRDASGRVFTTLGSRWSREREFLGL